MPYFPDFFKLMNEVENEDLVFTLETIVDKFGEEMSPYALGLCQNLVALDFLLVLSFRLRSSVHFIPCMSRLLHFGGA